VEIANFVGTYPITTQKVRNILFLFIAVAALIITGCSKKKNFIVQGQITGIGAQTVTATYYADGGLKRVSVMGLGDQFALRGEASRPTLVSLSLSDGTPIATLIAENGDKITLKGDISKPFEIKVDGNGDSEDIAEWVNANASILESRNASEINRSLAQWVGKNRSSKASTALIVTYFQASGFEHEADSLMSILSSSARAKEVVQNFTGVLSAQLNEAATMEIPSLYLYDSTDSVITFSPRRTKAMLICFLSEDRTARDSVSRRLHKLYGEYPSDKFQALEISTAADSSAWRSSISGDSAKWRMTWAPATIASSAIRKLAIPRTPYFIVADSAGTQIYRGASITAAAATVDKKLK